MCRILEDIDVDCAKEILVGQPGAGTGQLVVSAKLIMEIVWMSTPPPFVNLRLESSSTIIFEIF